MIECSWDDIKGYEEMYGITTLGDVISLDRYYSKGNRRLSPIQRPDGYLQVGLTKDKKYKSYLIHRLVAEAFIPNPDNLPEVNHKDEDKTNNHVDNLEWCDSSYNMNYSNSKKVYQYTKEGELVKEWDSLRSVSDAGFTSSTVSNCCNGNKGIKSHKDYIWSYNNLDR